MHCDTVVNDEKSKRDEVVKTLQSTGLPASVGPCPEIYNEKALINLGFGTEAECEVVHDLGHKSMVLSVRPGIERVMPMILDQIARV